MFGDLTKNDSLKFLEENAYGRLGCHAFGKTYVVPISFVYNDGMIYCHTHDGLKVRMMRNNPDVCFQVDSIDGMANWKSVIVQGNYKELEGKEKEKGLQALLNRKIPAMFSETMKLSPDWPFTTANYADIPGIVFSIEIKEITGKFEKANSAVRW